MPITLDETVSFATVAEADERAVWSRFSPVRAAAWLAATGDANVELKKSALITATEDINSVLGSGLYVIGDPIDAEQALVFPNEDYPTDFPQNLVAATIELAFTLLPTAASEPLDPVVNDKKRIKADDVDIEYFAPKERAAVSVERWPGIVQRLLAPFLQILVTEGVWGQGTAVRTS